MMTKAFMAVSLGTKRRAALLIFFILYFSLREALIENFARGPHAHAALAATGKPGGEEHKETDEEHRPDDHEERA